jgi:hypothetical protein
MDVSIPLNFHPEQTPWYLPVLDSTAQFKVLVCHRRARKTSLVAADLVRQKFLTSKNVLYLAPFREQARKLIWEAPNMLQNFMPPEVWACRNNSEMKCPTPNGGFLYVSGSDNYEAFRGMDIGYLALDEWDDQDPKLWNEVFLPILGVNGGKATIIGTLKGKADLWNKLQYALTSGDPNWYGLLLKASESGIVAKNVLEEIARTMPAATYAQEFECEAMADGATVFRNPRRLVASVPKQEPSHVHRMGVDLAKHTDYTVITVIDVSLPKFAVLPQRRFNRIEWSVQRGMIEAEYFKANRPEGHYDSTGIGDVVGEELEKTCRRLKGYRFTGPSREELINNLVLVMENDRISLPPDETLLAELESFRWVANRSDASPTDSRVKYRAEAPSSMHDDMVLSLALACWELPGTTVKAKSSLSMTPEEQKFYLAMREKKMIQARKGGSSLRMV